MEVREVREVVAALARDEADWKGPLPEGPLDRHLDSIQRLALVVAIEDRFQVCFEPEDEQRIRSVDDLVAGIMAKLEVHP
ncbi:MAG: acyl carrier protein [Deltaproteobacteria bacterium]|nr:acyl carrier protein [Deltaproteobacteria bacterium]